MKKLLLTVWIALTSLGFGVIALKPVDKPTQSQPQASNPLTNEFGGYDNIVDGMPIDSDPIFAMYGSTLAPNEQRGEEFRRYLAVSMKISVSGGSGSGTVVFFDAKDGYAYMQTCGHLWAKGKATPEEAKQRGMKCEVITWYQNEKKLDTPKKYQAEVLWYYNIRGTDSALIRFKPDYVPNYFPIAPANYPVTKGLRLHSVGCDGGREVAHYDVEVVGERSIGSFGPKGDTFDLITKDNSPRPGRSGGGLLTTDGWYVGICWGTSDTSGNGIGLFTPLKTVREMNEKNGYGWLNNIDTSAAARRIPIIDRNSPQRNYPNDYIPLPGGK